MFKKGIGSWTQYRNLPNHMVVDYHFESNNDQKNIGYYYKMKNAYEMALDGLRKAQEKGFEYVLLYHGRSTSRNGKATARSQVRNLMRSTLATPYIIRKECIQHRSVFVAAIRPKKS